MIDEGHVVGNHSVTHPAKGLPSQSIDTQAEELMALHRYVQETFDYDMYLFRYPAGIYSEQSLALVQQLGYRSVFWSFAYRDWVTDDQPEPTAALQKGNRKAAPRRDLSAARRFSHQHPNHGRFYRHRQTTGLCIW